MSDSEKSEGKEVKEAWRAGSLSTSGPGREITDQLRAGGGRLHARVGELMLAPEWSHGVVPLQRGWWFRFKKINQHLGAHFGREVGLPFQCTTS